MTGQNVVVHARMVANRAEQRSDGCGVDQASPLPPPPPPADYLRDVSRVLLHQLLPEREFSCRVQQSAAVELLSQLALLPLAQMLSEPDFVNRTIVWLVRRLGRHHITDLGFQSAV